MLSSIIAVIGTLAGAALSYLLQHRAARAERAEARAETRRSEQLAAVTALVSALADHRRAMWVREDLALNGPSDAYTAARAASHETRSALTAPLLTVTLLIPALAATAQAAAQATYDMRRAETARALADQRDAALVAADRLVTEAATALAA
ncbi:protein kilB [Streptomyces sp. NPDC059740]|uniref:protein kilB n=1 Tax=Streptomyces sp. NPDC059740 TaxID=3346926 RepID=UPI003666E735